MSAGREVGERSSRGWRFWIDRGGTFTDCIALAPAGALHTRKLLSHERAPVESIQAALREAADWRVGGALPACEVRLGTTLATNALLERRGARTLRATTHGLGDLLEIGSQERPDLAAAHRDAGRRRLGPPRRRRVRRRGGGGAAVVD